MNTVCVTGGDSRFFIHILMLIASFRRFCAGSRLVICDFGFKENELRYLARHGTVVPLPDSLRDVAHAWYRKASLCDYLKDIPFDAMVWVDADTLLLGNVPAALDGMSRQSGADVLACPTGKSISETIAELTAAGYDSVRTLEEHARRFHIDGTSPYLSTGVFLARSRTFLEGWKALTMQIPPHVMFDQTSFNIEARLGGVTGLVSGDVFNVYDVGLDALTRDGERIVNPRGETVQVVHFSASTPEVLSVREVSIQLNGRHLNGTLRRPRNRVLADLQHGHVEFILSEQTALEECGLLA